MTNEPSIFRAWPSPIVFRIVDEEVIIDNDQPIIFRSVLAQQLPFGPAWWTMWQFYRKKSSTDYDAEWASLRNLFYPEDYGAVGDWTTDDKTALQDCINACYTAWGGDVVLNWGKTYLIKPLATGIGLLLKTGVRLCWSGKIRAQSTTSSTLPFEVIAPFAYNTTATAFWAHELWIEDITIECDDYFYSNVANRNAHGLLGIIHCPRALIKNVTFGNVCNHQVEVWHSRNVLVENCCFKGNTEASRLQIDTGQAGQKSAIPKNYVNENITIRNCLFAGRDVTGQTQAMARMIEINHSVAQDNKNIIFEGCEFGAVFAPWANYLGYTLAVDPGAYARRITNLVVRGCRFYGQTHAQVYGIYFPFWANYVQGVVIEDNYFGPGVDCNGVNHAGGFACCMVIGENFGTSITAGSTVSTNYAKRQNIIIKNNVMEPRWQQWPCTVAVSGNTQVFNVGPLNNAEITGNIIIFPVHSWDFTAATSNLCTTTNSSTTHGWRTGDPIRVTTTGTLPGGLAINTTYYIKEILSETTFTLADVNGNEIDITSIGSGTHTWTAYLPNITLGFHVGFAVSEIKTLVFSNNMVLWQHSTAISSSVCYSMLMRVSALEAGAIPGNWEIINNIVSEVGAGSVSYGLMEWAASVVATPVVLWRMIWNQHIGTITNQNTLQGHPRWAGDRTTKRIVTVATATSITPNADTSDVTNQINTQTAGTLTINAPTGSPTDGQEWTLRIDSLNVQTFSWNAIFLGGTLALPTATTGANDIDYYRFMYYTADAKWHFMGSSTFAS